MLQRLLAVLILLAACTLPAAAENDIVHFGSTVVVPEGQSAGNIACFLCSVEAKGPVHGDIAVVWGSVHLNDRVGGDVAIFAGNLWLNGDASIARDLVIFGGGIRGEEGHAVGGSRAIFPPIIFLPILLVIALVSWGLWLLARWLIRGRQSYYPVPPR